MSRPKAAAPPPIRLDPARVNAWRIDRQLLGREKAANPVEVAQRLIGVQAQVTSSAALSIALRSKPARGKAPAINATTRALLDRRLVRSWAMRGTLHLFAADDVPTVAAALQNREMWRRPAWLRWFGVTEKEMERLIDTIGEVLDDGRPRSRAELAEEIGGRLGAKTGKLLLGSWGGTLKVASDRHYLVQSAEDDAGVRFVRASRWIETWRQEDRHEALATLVERYLAAYGPATLKEVLRWWGVAVVAMLKPVIEALGDRLTEVEVDGVRAYVRTADVEAIEATRAEEKPRRARRRVRSVHRRRRAPRAAPPARAPEARLADRRVDLAGRARRRGRGRRLGFGAIRRPAGDHGRPLRAGSPEGPGLDRGGCRAGRDRAGPGRGRCLRPGLRGLGSATDDRSGGCLIEGGPHGRAVPSPGCSRRALALADDDADDDDLRLRKRIGVAAGFLTILGPLSLPILALGHPIALIVGPALSAFSVANLVVLARTKRFERYVALLVGAGTVFVPVATWLSGGIPVATSALDLGLPGSGLRAPRPRARHGRPMVRGLPRRHRGRVGA